MQFNDYDFTQAAQVLWRINPAVQRDFKDTIAFLKWMKDRTIENYTNYIERDEPKNRNYYWSTYGFDIYVVSEEVMTDWGGVYDKAVNITTLRVEVAITPHVVMAYLEK